jgi:hypothetical protein
VRPGFALPAATFALLLPHEAAAHAIAERYDLPVPLGFYVAGAAATVALSFVVIGAFAYAAPPRAPRLVALGRWTAPTCAIRLLQAVGVFLFLLTIGTGLFGSSHPARNWAPTMVWVVGWVGLNFITAFVGNLWPALNPWATLFDVAQALRGGARPARPYPARWGAWPAVILLLAFAWIEVVFPLASDPQALALLILLYSLLTLTGMAMFGRDAWLQHGEVFAVLFGTLGRFAPLTRTHMGMQLRPYASGLRADTPLAPGMVAFILLMLATVLFDGFLGTSIWRASESALGQLLPRGVDRFGTGRATIGLLAIWAAFLGAYLATCAITARMVPGASTAALARLFAPSLVPIAVGYNMAHNLSYLLIQGQTIAALASDPFGFGWNLFGSVRYRPDITVIDAETTWYVAIIAIVGGHLISVYLAHLAALRLGGGRRAAIVALIPMTVLMVIYTGISLSILAEPMVRYSTPDPGYS